jgi:hypothetical protein
MRQRQTKENLGYPLGASSFNLHPFCVIGASARGASHVRAGRPNQDAIDWRVGPDLILLSLADGHGSTRYVRSHQGAKLAVQIALEQLGQFLRTPQDPEASAPNRVGDATLKRRAEEQLPRTLVRAWQDAVAEQLARVPLTEQELNTLERLMPDKERRALAEFPQRVFGATLLAGAVTEDFALFLQLGDGDIVTVDATGEPSRLPIAPDERLIANQTTSLAGPRAWQDLRVYFHPFVQQPPSLLLFATDGYANSFQDPDGLLAAAADLHALFGAGRAGFIRRNLPRWLAETSELGSGDDITVGLIAMQQPMRDEK